ncbi:SDR family NAD(P)-dependent oxidoreductase [Cellulomonas fengjieae]|uniref:SDR family oxidoreductase n=1 Tax=Cellulomonas fengjieae TaxID=2819978 RepID=A0ABS3SG50_9CELL|nr:SDR family oxidoreductase [Cellulomonas fengjieae]MBO3084735.1 SDR family oxidoreductase [Cellulomonas fengjieae]QVI66943.1 SDR family oxidoreductase [Cellulomonas fengjieae]
MAGNGRLDGLRVLLTGGGSGIGLAIVQRYVEEGAIVSVADLNPAAAPAVESLGARFAAVDVADADAVVAWVDQEAAALGGIDVAVAGAGYQLVAMATDLTVEQWDHQMAVMLRGPFVLFKSVLPYVIEGGGGSLIVIGSNLSFAGMTKTTSYTAAKHGVIGLVQVLAVDYAQDGVRVNALCPGPTDTPLIRRQLEEAADPAAKLAQWNSDMVLNRLGTPEEIAAGAVFLASDESSFVTGSSLMIDGGFTAW